jgi:hypothetical protein
MSENVKLVRYVRAYNRENLRGCPAGVCQWVGGFTANEIMFAKMNGDLEVSYGRCGGLWPTGEAPKPQKVPTLKGRAMQWIETTIEAGTIDKRTGKLILKDYEDECERRRLDRSE